MGLLLLISAAVVATCGLVYELLAGTLASYLLGDSVTQFSTVIGAYLFAMGIGSWLSRWVRSRVLEAFIRVELLVGLVGGTSAAVLFLMFAWAAHFRIVLYAEVVLTGVLVGLEIPLLLRILKDQYEFRDLVARVLSFDYVGALAASIVFPLLCVPYLGLVRTGFFFGLINTAIALVLLWKLAPGRKVIRLRTAGIAVLLVLLVGFAMAERMTTWAEDVEYPGRVVYATNTPYQRLVITRERDDWRLFLNGNLQFSSRDEYRYHEALVHQVMARLPRAQTVLILGGGDGLALREVLRYPGVRQVTLVDLDPGMTELFSTSAALRLLNGDALHSQRLHIVHADAFVWMRSNQERFDAIIADFPDPGNFSVGKLYTETFYRELARALQRSGIAVVQSTSPFFARRAFWCVERTLSAAGLRTYPYHVMVPSFGEWGYIMASHDSLPPVAALPAGLRFADKATLAQAFEFPPDMSRVETESNRLDNQILVHYFDEEWSRVTTSF